MTPAARPRLLERLARLSKLAALPALAFVLLMAYVRGQPVPPPQPERLPQLIVKICEGAAEVDSQAALDDVAAVAASLVAGEGVTPGAFHVLHLPRLDALEKFHHLMHGPFTGIRRMYCDVWVHSLTTYGALERTWGFGEVWVRPALKLPVLLFLIDRLGRGKSSAGEYAGAPLEAVTGMDMHELAGRARLWKRVLAMADRHPELAEFVRVQLSLYQPGWIDGAEVGFWSAVAAAPTRARVDEIAGGGEGAPSPTPEPAKWAAAWRALWMDARSR